MFSLFLRGWLGAHHAGAGVQMRCRFLNGRKISLGPRTVINFGCLLDGRRYPITTGSDVSIGPEATILTLGHDPQSPEFELKGGPVTIGEGAVVAAGAVVTRDVAPYTIVAGNPAREIGTRGRELTYSLAYRPWLT